MEGGLDGLECINIADKIGCSPKVVRLGLELGFDIPATDMYDKMNRDGVTVTSSGTRKMITGWKENVVPKDQRPQLKAALERAGLAEIAEIYLAQDHHPGTSVQNGLSENTGTSQRLAAKRRMNGDENGHAEGEPLSIFRRIEGEPLSIFRRIEEKILNGEPVTDAEREEHDAQKQIHIPLELFQSNLKKQYQDPTRLTVPISVTEFRPQLHRRSPVKGSRYVEMIPMENSHNDIFNTSPGHWTRYLVSSKSKAKNIALSRRLCYDYATQDPSSPLRRVPLVFNINLEEVTPHQDLADAIKEQQFGNQKEVQASHIRALIQDSPGAVTVILDGLEGFQRKGYTGNIHRIIMGEEMRDVTIMVTSDPCAAFTLVDCYKPQLTYTHIEMT